MDQKRAIFAVVLSMIVLVLWSWIYSPQPRQQAPTPEAAQSAPAGQGGASPEATPETAQSPLPSAFTAAKGVDVTVDTPLYSAVFTTEGGVLKHFRLKHYKQSIAADAQPVDLIGPDALDKGPMGLLWNGQATWRAGQWSADVPSLTLGADESGQLTFTGRLGDLVIVRTISVTADNYLMQEDVVLHNGTATPMTGRLGFSLASNALTSEDDKYNQTRVSWKDADGLDDEADADDDLAQGVIRQNGVLWGAVQSNYFILAAAPEVGQTVMKAKFEDGVYRVAMEKPEVSLPASGQTMEHTAWYLGPMETKPLSAAPNELGDALDYGYFDIIAKPLLVGLNYFYGYVGNYGWAIIILTVVIKIIFWPLSHKSYKSMNKMKKIQPLMADVREKYKDDREKMNQEMIRLYKTYKVNPAGGCLPMMLQIPVFIGLYQALLGAIEMRHAPFIVHLPFTDLVWLADLSAKDPFYITPIIMGATMFLQQKMTPAPGDPTQAKIMLFLPVIFTFVFLNFPSGLVVYWLVNNVLSIAQQGYLTRQS